MFEIASKGQLRTSDWLDDNDDVISTREYCEEDHSRILMVAKTLTEWFDENEVNHAIPTDLRFHRGFIAIDKTGMIVGFITTIVWEGRLIIGWMGVHREYQRQGIGKKLLKRAERYALENNISEVATYTLGNNTRNPLYANTREFYFKNGFQIYMRSVTDNPNSPVEIKLKKNLDNNKK